MRKQKKVKVFKTGKTWKGQNALTGESVSLANIGVRTELRANGTYEVFNTAGKVITTFTAPVPFTHK